MGLTDVGFNIGGTFYEVPLPHTFDIDECGIYYRYTGHVVEAIWLDDKPVADLFYTDGFLPALVHIAYRRAHPEVEDDAVKALVGKQNRLELFGAMVGGLLGEPEDEDPKAQATTESDASWKPSNDQKPSTPNGSESSSGRHSMTSSVPPVVARGTTGIIGSDTPSASDRLRPVA